MKHMRTTLLIFLMVPHLISAGRKHTKDEIWLFEINNKRLSLKDLHNAYLGFQVLMKEQVQTRFGRIITDQEFSNWLEDPTTISDETQRHYLSSFAEENFSEQYAEIELVAAEAKKNGYDKLPETQARLDFLQKYFLANLYIFSRLDIDNIVVTEAEIQGQIKYLEKQAMTVDLSKEEVRAKARANVIMVKGINRQAELMKLFRESSKFSKNPEADVKILIKTEKALHK